MRVSVKGADRDLKAALVSASVLCAEYLMPRLRASLQLNIELCSLDDANAYCDPDECSGARRTRPRAFDIQLEKSLPLEDMLLAFCHEMVHVKQFARSELQYGSGGDFRWKGVDYVDTPYDDQPWETEAYNMQSLLLSYCKVYKVL